METQFNWKINALELYPTYETYENVVFNIHWSCYGSKDVTVINTDEQGLETSSSIQYTANSIGVTGVTLQSGSSFIPYDELTEEIVVSWLHYQMGDEQKQDVEQNVSTAIDNKINPPVVKKPLPWTVNQVVVEEPVVEEPVVEEPVVEEPVVEEPVVEEPVVEEPVVEEPVVEEPVVEEPVV